MVFLRSFGADGKVSGEGRSETTWDLIKQGLILFPFKFGWRCWSRMDEHSRAGKKLHKAFAAANAKAAPMLIRKARKGCASGIIAKACSDADELDRILYLSSSDRRNQKFYERFGFARIGSVVLRLGVDTITTVGMVRVPQSSYGKGLELASAAELECTAQESVLMSGTAGVAVVIMGCIAAALGFWQARPRPNSKAGTQA